MSVYVDEAKYQLGRMKMCHMVADSIDELHTMARCLGLRRDWFQTHSALPHYDICKAKRQRSIQLGAIVIGRRELVAMIRNYRAKAPRMTTALLLALLACGPDSYDVPPVVIVEVVAL